MNRPRIIAILVAVAVLSTAPVAADPMPDSAVPAPDAGTPDAPPGTTYLHVRSGAHLTTDGGSDLTVPPGYYLDEASWDRVDAEMRRLQDAETRLAAENDVFRKDSASGLGWGTLLVAGLAVLAGAAVDRYVFR